MYKVLLVDDDEIIREGLTQLICWEEYELEISACASNGREALEIIKYSHVDILITDIRMPDIDGVQLIKNLREQKYNIKCIVLSGYSDFEYVKQAAILGIENYILKPVDDKELVSTLTGTVSKLEQEEARKQIELEGASVLKNNILSRWVSGSIDEYELIEKANFIGIDINILEYITAVITEIQVGLMQEKLLHVVKNCCESMSVAGMNITSFLDFQGNVVLLFSGDDLSATEAEIKEFLSQLPYRIAENTGANIFISVSSIIRGYRNVHKSYVNAMKLQNNSFIFGKNKVVYQDEIEALSVRNYRDNKSNAIIQRVKEYVEKNYTLDINLKTISSIFKMNTFYLGQIFKDETGETFTHYLNNYRIEKAKILLSEGIIKANDVAVKVGYINSNYFYSLFKKIVGVSPTLYKEISVITTPKEDH
jgi:Response regulator containing CheY-like receiver domain and AraC-type DNA-binding domain